MRSRVLMMIAILVVAFFAVGCASMQTKAMNMKLKQMARTEGTLEDYRVAAPDQLTVEVKGWPEYTRTQTVRPDGRITIPDIGDIMVQGLTIPEITAAANEKLQNVLSEPSVTVTLVASTSKAVYVLGEVKRPGIQPYYGDMRLIDAVSMAQGVSFYGDWRLVTLTRESVDGVPDVFVIDLRKLVDKGRGEQNVILKEGDIIYIPPTGFAKVGYAFDQLLFPFRSVLSGLVTYGGVRSALND